ncbi:hypothetical protein RRG08_063841 [Elysia crispata]|uniref:Uncharacterized protein n=1 Tax=Elysia crispata TaxID=231223 RepID=A0AAE0Y5Q4_9GAST|nr:hypothetical protein RRG08_063841 [Elysia crispata]
MRFSPSLVDRLAANDALRWFVKLSLAPSSLSKANFAENQSWALLPISLLALNIWYDYGVASTAVDGGIDF